MPLYGPFSISGGQNPGTSIARLRSAIPGIEGVTSYAGPGGFGTGALGFTHGRQLFPGQMPGTLDQVLASSRLEGVNPSLSFRGFPGDDLTIRLDPREWSPRGMPGGFDDEGPRLDPREMVPRGQPGGLEDMIFRKMIGQGVPWGSGGAGWGIDRSIDRIGNESGVGVGPGPGVSAPGGPSTGPAAPGGPSGPAPDPGGLTGLGVGASPPGISGSVTSPGIAGVVAAASGNVIGLLGALANSGMFSGLFNTPPTEYGFQPEEAAVEGAQGVTASGPGATGPGATGPGAAAAAAAAAANAAVDVAGAGAGAGAGPGDSTVICTELHRQGLMDDATFARDDAFARAVDPDVRRGYLRWALPVVRGMRRSRAFTRLVWFVARPWAREMAYGDSVIGRVIMRVGVPLCRLLGRVHFVNAADVLALDRRQRARTGEA